MYEGSYSCMCITQQRIIDNALWALCNYETIIFGTCQIYFYNDSRIYIPQARMLLVNKAESLANL